MVVDLRARRRLSDSRIGTLTCSVALQRTSVVSAGDQRSVPEKSEAGLIRDPWRTHFACRVETLLDACTQPLVLLRDLDQSSLHGIVLDVCSYALEFGLVSCSLIVRLLLPEGLPGRGREWQGTMQTARREYA